MCVSVLVVTWLLALVMGYNPGEAAGLLAGSQTISAVIGVAEDTMANMGLDEAQRQSYVNIIPVSYAVTYVSVRQAQLGYSPPSVQNYWADWRK